MKLLPGISGIIPVKNAIRLDYSVEAAARSMLPVCDEVIISDGGSDDGTREFFLKWAETEPKIRVVDYQWPSPVGDLWFLVKWLNWTQQFCRYDMTACLDADEVFCPKGYAEMRLAARQHGCRYFTRLNFWKDPHHLIPEGYVCGTQVCRLGPTEYPAVSDNIYEADKEPRIKREAVSWGTLRIFHVGFLRRPEPFRAKAKAILSYLLNTWDKRIDDVLDAGRPLHEFQDFPVPLPEYNGSDWPDTIVPWLKERGYTL